jgi:hypothetical protein
MNDRFRVRPPGEVERWATAADAALIRGMLERGDKQSDVAAWFGTNSGRICETRTGKRFKDVPPAPSDQLPPAGPHVSAPAVVEITGIAAEFRREQQRTNEKLDHVLRQLAAFGRKVGVIEPPRAPRIGRHKPMEA